jgi:hypothetical protein
LLTFPSRQRRNRCRAPNPEAGGENSVGGFRRCAQAKQIGGRGYLVFKQPDRFHLAVFSPFGFTMMDLFVAADRITCLIPAKQTAYQGLISDIPVDNALKGWGMMRWVVEPAPVSEGNQATTQEVITPEGKKEILCYDDRGLLSSKTNEEGDRVVYKDYHDRNGVAFPSDRNGNAKGIRFDFF